MKGRRRRSFVPTPQHSVRCGAEETGLARSLARVQAASAGSAGTGTQALNGRGDPSSSAGLGALPPCPEPGELAEVCVLGLPDPH